jgi:hypothetical protein
LPAGLVHSFLAPQFILKSGPGRFFILRLAGGALRKLDAKLFFEIVVQ